MTWEQKLQALSALSSCNLVMRKPGDWYVQQSVNIGGDGFLRGNYGVGATPEDAVINHWSELVEQLPSDRHLRVGDNNFRWNGFMWADAHE